ncbi:hypothetical protein TNCV_4958901 [Trichonephila clavipes]|uniref:Uncharacterized protein n=1 Tax=Trichonephila clavipes TaxID=2585209 RepID=A0A8X6VNN3_TRICX|nr:hypothetical protein TNCV_4958901 [Trichonephila clavipes]
MHGSVFQTVIVAGWNHIMLSLADKHMLEGMTVVQAGEHCLVKNILRISLGEDRMLSRHFPHTWLPRSPDLNPNDYWQ